MASKRIRRAMTFLVLAVAVAATLTSANVARGGKPSGKPSATPAPYAITDFGSPRYRNWHSYWSRAYGINEPDSQGFMDVVGWDDVGSAVWEAAANGGVVSRDNLGAGRKVTAVSGNGLIVGTFDNHLFANVPGVGMVDLPESAGFLPAAVNNLGHVVSQQQQPGYPGLGRGAMWTIAADGSVSAPIDLGTFRPLDINDWDEMAGLQDSAAAIAWFEDGALQTSKLPGLWPGDLGVATAINNWGEVVGYSTDLLIDTGTYSPFLWSADKGLKGLGSLGGVHGKALDINDGGQIVGWSYTSAHPFNELHAFLWEQGAMFDLNGKIDTDTNRTLQSADGINNFGHIVGSMFTAKGKTTTLKSFLLTPRP